jgi:hypothetical protein
MSDQDFTLQSGAKLHVTMSSFADANALVKALMKAAKGVPLGDDIMKQDLTALKDVLIEAAASPDVERCLYRCMERGSYNDIKLIPVNFDPLGDSFRKDYFEVCWKVIEVNCRPFFDTAFSALKARLGSATAAQKST